MTSELEMQVVCAQSRRSNEFVLTRKREIRSKAFEKYRIHLLDREMEICLICQQSQLLSVYYNVEFRNILIF